MTKVEITLESGTYHSNVHGGIIHTSVGYSFGAKEGSSGSYGGADNKEEVEESIKYAKEQILKNDCIPVIVDKRTTQPKGELDCWMGNDVSKDLKVKFDLMWRFNREHKKEHYILKWTNYREFGDMIGKRAYCYCCDWEGTGAVKEHPHFPMEEKIRKFLKHNELDYEYEIEHEGFENFNSCEVRWDILDEANDWKDKLVEHCGFEEYIGISVMTLKDIKEKYKEVKNKVQFKIYLKKCVDLHFEVDCREANENGNFITEGFEPTKNDYGAMNILKVKRWLEGLK